MTNQGNADNWFVSKDGIQQGPLTYQALLASIRQGLTTSNDLVWTLGFEKWVPASTVAGLFSPPAGASPTFKQQPSLQPPPLPSTATGQAAKISDVLRDDLLEHFIGSNPKKKNYYRRVFSQIMEEAGVSNKFLDEIELGDIRRWKGLMTKGSGVTALPFRHDTIFNWAAFFLWPYWVVWRIAYLRWLFVTAFLVLSVSSEFSRLAWGPLFGLQIFAGGAGNRLLLIELLTELKTGAVRSKPTKPSHVIFVLIAIIIITIAFAARH